MISRCTRGVHWDDEDWNTDTMTVIEKIVTESMATAMSCNKRSAASPFTDLANPVGI